MELCDRGHDEVAHEGRHCPACQMKNERDDALSDLERANAEIADLKEEVAS